MAFTQGLYTDDVTVERMLTVIHELEPSGVGARDLQECLLLQLKHKTPSESVELATLSKINLMPLQKKHYEKLIQNIMFQMSSLKAIHEKKSSIKNQVVLLRETIKLRKM
jgi:RNA polymerase sigma-54 factor